MKVLLVGGGGREHALAWKISGSPLLKKLYAAPGNPGIRQHAELAQINVEDHKATVDFCKEKGIDLVVVGPEAPLAAGIADVLREQGIKVFGPSAAAARLESSKSFTKNLCARFNIPSASFRCFTEVQEARSWVNQKGAPIVVKADGLAAGKGVTVALSVKEALDAVDSCFSGVFGKAGAEVVIEEFLEGDEASFFCLCDGTKIIPFGSAQDHKRLGEGDTGPNTGGMGAISPSFSINDEITTCILEKIIHPSILGMKQIGVPFSGVLYAGLMITADGPKLIEYNVRFGDPECQALVMRLEDDLLGLLYACSEGRLPQISPRWSKECAISVVLAARGYPDSGVGNSIIKGLENDPDDKTRIFHGSTILKEGEIVAHSGRALTVAAKGETVAKAREKAYRRIEKIDWPEGFFRSDIGVSRFIKEKITK